MRFKKSDKKLTIYSVSGNHTVSFCIEMEKENCDELLGFAIKRKDVTEKENYFMRGFKVFKKTVPNPKAGELYSTYEHPIQSFTWEDFTAKPSHKYIYYFYPVSGEPKNLKYGKPVSITVRTEIINDPEAVHDVFFNRGAASSQAYATRFQNKKPEDVPGREAFIWLSRCLEEAILAFIKRAEDGSYGLRGCFYEFHYMPVLEEFRKAIDRGADVQIIYDAKENGSIDKKTGETSESFPKIENEKAIKKARLENYVTPRTAIKSYIAHNKFMVLLKDGIPVEVWTGSTNISKSGIFGQTNVGHWIREKQVAENFYKYWEYLHADPTGKELKDQTETIQEDFGLADMGDQIKTIFSPRHKETMLETYAELLDSATSASCITLAFGVNNYIKNIIEDNTDKSHLTFMLLEKDAADISDFIPEHNVVKAVGSYFKDPLYKWISEKSPMSLGLGKHVMFIHSKFLLVDPLSASPIIVSGSANFSPGSTTQNDENMVLIKGDTRAADIYFTEFMRLFNHYYFRWVMQKMMKKGQKPKNNPAFLLTDNSWVEKYFKPGSYHSKKLNMFREMDGFK